MFCYYEVKNTVYSQSYYAYISRGLIVLIFKPLAELENQEELLSGIRIMFDERSEKNTRTRFNSSLVLVE